ncbi:ECF-type sigma factor [Aquimonas voraii]|uniref:RNA polymerase sigma factor, TIGR02999 family n=1 Tax=Aquimonas voraii TaxID=265719 RepID=A0A1G6T857_9GAMM|nr:ECF-type sigma factor [Aquimonas voraii]SDD25054.1 RNA polymerase sigma factor, TIGR02999 family [Aquimonas voraii]
MHSPDARPHSPPSTVGQKAAARSLSDLYARLKRIAGRQLGQAPSPATLSATVLVHEAYLRVAGGGLLEARDESHLLSLWTRTMRHVLIDYCRARATAKRSGHKLDIDELDCAQRADPDALLALEQSLRALDAHDPRLAQVIELRVFAGLDTHGIAAQLGLDVRTVQRDWVRARAWLQDSVAPC